MSKEFSASPKNKVVIESVTKASRLMHPNDSRALVYDPLKQRNTAFIDKGITKPGRITFEVLRRAAQSVHVARICINTLKEKVTKTKWVIKPTNTQTTKTDKKDDRIDEITNLLRVPNENNESFRTFLDKALEDLLILDTVVIEKVRYPNGKIARLYTVDAATIRPVFDEYGNIDVEIPLNTDEGMRDLPVSYVQVMNNSQYGGPESGEIVAAWPQKDMLYFHMHPQGSFEGIGYGLSPLEGVLSVVANILNADNYNGTYFEEGSFPPVIIQILGQVNQRDVEQYRNYLESELMGNFHRPAIMAGGQEAKVLNLKDLTNRDMEFMEYMKFMSRLLAAAYGLSGQDIGLTDEVGSKNVAETQADLSGQKGYGSLLNLLAEVINQNIIWGDFGYKDLEFEWVADDNIDPKDASDIHDKALRNGTMTINEVRQKAGLDPFDDWADKPMVLTGEGFKQISYSEPVEAPDTTQEEVPADNREIEDTKPEVKKTPLVKRMLKAIFPGNVESEFEESPTMFGTLVEDKALINKIQKVFADRDYSKLAKLGLLEHSYSSQFNNAKEILRTFVEKYPASYGGITYTKDVRGVRYTIYVKHVSNL